MIFAIVALWAWIIIGALHWYFGMTRYFKFVYLYPHEVIIQAPWRLLRAVWALVR